MNDEALKAMRETADAEASVEAEAEGWRNAEQVGFCDCTNEQLERGLTCCRPDCPNLKS